MIFTYLTIGLFIIMLGILFIYPYFSKKDKMLKLVEKNKNYRYFMYFLLENDLYKPFIKNLVKEKNIKEIHKWIRYVNKDYYLSEAFNWYNTSQGFDFWYLENKKWYKTKKIKDEENVLFIIVCELIKKKI